MASDDTEPVISIETPTTRIRDVHGLPDTEELMGSVETLAKAVEHRGGDQIIPSLLIYGPTGVGKSLVSEVVATELLKSLEDGSSAQDEKNGSVGRFLRTESESLKHKYTGVTERRLVEVFDKLIDTAEQDFKPILLIDGLDRLVPAPDVGTRKPGNVSILQLIIQVMNRDEVVRSGTVLIATANTPFDIDAGLRNRFTTTHLVEPATSAEALAEFWEHRTADHPLCEQLDYKRLGEASIGLTGAELNAVQKRLAGPDRIAEVTDSEPVTTEDYLRTLESTEPEVLRRYRTKLDEISGNLSQYPQLESFYEEMTSAGLIE